MPASSSSSQRPSTKRERERVRERISLFPLLAVYFPRERMSQMLPSSSTGTRQKEEQRKIHAQKKERERERKEAKRARALRLSSIIFRERALGCVVWCSLSFWGKKILLVFVCFDLHRAPLSLFFFLWKGTLSQKYLFSTNTLSPTHKLNARCVLNNQHARVIKL